MKKFTRQLPESEMEELNRLHNGKHWKISAASDGKILSIRTKNKDVEKWARAKGLIEDV